MDTRPLHGIYVRKNIDVVTVGPFFEASVACSGGRTGIAAASEAGGCKTGCTAASDVGGSGGEGREVVSSVLTSADPIPKVDVRKASEVANGNEEQTWRREQGR